MTDIILNREKETEWNFIYKDIPKCQTCRMELLDWKDEDGNKYTAPLLYCDSTCEKIGNTYSRMFGLYRKSVV
jgi:hypothetical protein